MEKITIWFITDNDSGRQTAGLVSELGLNINTLNLDEFQDGNIIDTDINIFVFYCNQRDSASLMEFISGDRRIEGFIKYVMLPRKEIRKLSGNSYNLMHLEFVPLPIDRAVLLLLIEKTAVVERYREMMKYISLESDTRIEAFEGLLDINRKKVFGSEKEKQNFESILDFEKSLIQQQQKLNDAISEFTLLRQNEIFDLHERIRAEEIINDLHKRELMEADRVIDAQSNVLEYSAVELGDAREIIDATEKLAELSRTEALTLHQELEEAKEAILLLEKQVEELQQENQDLKRG